MNGGRVVDAVAKETNDMSALAQGLDDALLLFGIDTREQTGAFGLYGKPAIGQGGDVRSGQHAI